MFFFRPEPEEDFGLGGVLLRHGHWCSPVNAVFASVIGIVLRTNYAASLLVTRTWFETVISIVSCPVCRYRVPREQMSERQIEALTIG